MIRVKQGEVIPKVPSDETKDYKALENKSEGSKLIYLFLNAGTICSRFYLKIHLKLGTILATKMYARLI